MIIKALGYSGVTFIAGMIISMIVAAIIHLIAVTIKQNDHNSKA